MANYIVELKAGFKLYFESPFFITHCLLVVAILSRAS